MSSRADGEPLRFWGTENKDKCEVSHLPNLHICLWMPSHRDVNTLRPRQNGRHFPDDIFKCIFLNENVWIPIKISLKFVPRGPINNIPAMVQIMAWRRPGDKPLSEPMMVSSLTHICVTRPQWVKGWCLFFGFNNQTDQLHDTLL